MPFVFREVGGIGLYEVSGWQGARGLFTTRSLDMGSGGGHGAALQNRARLASALGMGPGGIKTVRQVHGSDVYVLDRPDEAGPERGYDAILTGVGGVAVGVLTADCVPLLLYDPVARAVGAVHAGWSGTVQGIAGKAVGEMRRTFGSRPENILACVGPSIGPCCYEVDEAVMAPLRGAAPDSWEGLVSPSRPGHWLLDLWKTNKRMLQAAGVAPDGISVFGACTACNQDKFYSHRKSGGKAGRMLALCFLT